MNSMSAPNRSLAALGSIAALAAGLPACTTAPAEAKLVRLVLADRTYLELQLPKGWTLEPSFADGPRLSQARLSAREPGSTQMWIIPRLDTVRGARANSTGARERARRELITGKDCEGIGPITQERGTAYGVAVFCSRPQDSAAPRLLPSTAGAVAIPDLVVRFAMLGVSNEENAAAWSILNSLQLATIESSP